jgi:hypothetical protein
MHGAESRATERPRGYLRAQSLTLAWHEDSACVRSGCGLSLLVAHLLKGRPTDLTPPCRGPVLRALEHGAQSRASSGQDENREAVRQDVLFGKLGLGLFARRGQRARRREFD